MIDPEDIARVAVVALTEAGHEGKGYFITGPEALTSREQVEIIAEVTGRPIESEDLTPHEFTKVAVQSGTPPEQAYLMERLNDPLRAGRAGFATDDVENLTGFAPGAFRAWCERNVDALR